MLHKIKKITELFIPVLYLYKNIVSQNRKSVIFITSYISSRIEKMGYALRKKGYNVILLVHKEGKSIGVSYGSKNNSYDKLYFFRNKAELYFLCLRFNPLVYHVCERSRVSDWCVFLIKNKQYIGKIVYDQYDVYRDMYAEKNVDYIKNEKFCLENADGIVCRNFQTQYLKNKYGYCFKGKRLLFLDYCWNNNPPEKRFKTDKEELCIVYGGRLLPCRSNNLLSRIEWDGLSSWVETTKQYQAKMVVIASNIIDKNEFKEFSRLAKNNPNFILKGKMDLNTLIEYESKMDYGTDTFELARDQKNNFKNFNFAAREKYCATNKYFDYIDAGIPIICGRPQEMLGRYLEKYGIVFRCTLEELPERMDELKQKRNGYAVNVAKARKALSIEKQIPRLIHFYKQL